MSVKFIHIADLHCCREQAEASLASLAALTKYIEKNPVNLVVIAGDTWDAAITNTEASGYNQFTDAIRGIADLAPVAMIYGTPSHDTDGSLEIFEKIDCKQGIHVLKPTEAYFLIRGNLVTGEFLAKKSPECYGLPEALVFGIPEPRKKFLLADTSTGNAETEDAIRDALHKICYLMGAKRKEYSGIPCICLYHGDVSGSTLQNNEVIERGTGIGMTIDDLSDIGADYYALGHIHLPQKVGKLPAYYAGSIYPKNFGETHKAGFNVIEFEEGNPYGFAAKVDRVDFPHPENCKMEIALRENCKPDDCCLTFAVEKIKGKKVWVEFTCTKEQRALMDPEAELRRLLEAGAVEGSRVTISDIPIETVRAAEIAEVNTPSKKFEIWAKNSNLETRESHIKKIEALETELSHGSIKAEGEWELVSIRLKGAIGIFKGIKKEGIDIDFDNYSSGIIALIGANGRGKTTLIENCHPYPQLLTRRGKLQDHFFLKDSYREVVYRNRQFGIMRKFLIQIDGQNKSGSCKYFIFAKARPDGEWEPLPGVDGNLKPYEEALQATFGPIELFQRTAFITQKSTKNLPDITDATAGEKKSLFVALAGIDYLQGFSDAASEKEKQEDIKAHDAEIKAEMLKAKIDGKALEEEALKTYESGLSISKNKLQEITVQGQASKAEVERLQTEWNTEQVRQQKEAEAKAAVDALCAEICGLADEIDVQKDISNNKAQYESEVAEYEKLQKIVVAENAKKQAITERNLKTQQDYAAAKATHEKALRGVETESDALCDQRGRIQQLVLIAEGNIRLSEAKHESEKDRLCKPLLDRKLEIGNLIATAQNNIKLYERDARDTNENCPECGQKLPENKIAELKAKRDEFVRKIATEKEKIDGLNLELEDIDNVKIKAAIDKAVQSRETYIGSEKRTIEAHKAELEKIAQKLDELSKEVWDITANEPKIPIMESFSDTTLKAATEKQSGIDIERSRAALVQAQESAVRIEGLHKQIDDKQKLRAAKEAEYKSITQDPAIGEKIKTDLDAAIAKHEELTEKYTHVKTEIARIEASIEAVHKTLAEIAEKEKEYELLRAQNQLAVAESREWELIAKAYGKDGIQALELDALAPGISDTANRILESADGDRFRIDIRTTRIGGTGKKVKQIEDFLIYIIDSEDGEAVLLDDKSGGEAVWIKRAIYDAFAVIRKRNTNFAFLTCFQDETDGALDSAAKTAYCRMLEAAHAESKLRHTIIITHSNEVKAMIEQQIDMETLK